MKHLLLIVPIWVCFSACGQNNDSALVYYKAGITEKAEKRFLVASQKFEKAISFNPNYKEAYLAHAFTNLEMKRTDPAKASFTKVNELDPTNQEAIKELMTIYFNYRQFAKAIEFTEKCKDCEQSLRIAGLCYYQQEEYVKAEKFLKAALVKNPADAEAAYNLGRTYVDMEEYKKSIPFYEMAIKMEGAKNTWVYELGLLYFNQSDYKNAVITFQRAADNGYAQTSDFNENFGFAALYTGDYEKGERLIMDIWNKKPGNKDLLRDMAEILYKQKQFDKSLAYCQKLMEVDVNDGKALYQAGLNFQRKGEKDRGTQMCDRAIQLDPTLDALRRKKEMSGL